MTAGAGDFATMHFSTDALAERDRVPMLHEFVGPLVARLDIEPMGRDPCHFEITARALPDLAVSTLAFSAIRVERSRALIADGNDSCLLSCIHSPGNTVTQRGREFTPPRGTGILLSMADPFTCATFSGIALGITISVPRKVLTAISPRIEDSFGRALIRNSEPFRLVRSYVGLLDQNQVASPGLRSLVVRHIHDLVALALGASNDAAEIANGRGLRAARLHAIKAAILASLGEQGLSLTAIAAQHGLSSRYVQALFESDGATFSQFILAERLARVHRMLCDPLQMNRSISAIAYDAGFGDLSHFNRAFRRRYGATPSDIRAAARNEQND